MAERLTKCIDSHLLDNGEMVKEYSLNSKIELNHFSCMDIPNAVYDKLGMLEDIMERLGINFVEDLEDEVRSLRVDKYIYKKDRDTWKRACELACEREDDCYVYDNIHRAYEFYQQAKKEGE